MSIVVLVNPRSRANRRDPGLAQRFAALLGEQGRVMAPGSLAELTHEMIRLADTPPAIIGIHGGDGTLHQGVSALVKAWGDRPLPTIAILPGGTMNVVASSLGIRVDPSDLIRELVSDARDGRAPVIIRRHCLRIGDDFGFVFGNGFMANFLEAYYGPGLPGYGAVKASFLLSRTLGSAVIKGRFARKMSRPFEGRVTVDGRLLPWQRLTGIGAATVREVGLGFKLNHRADEHPDRFSVIAIHADLIKLAADLIPVFVGDGVAPDHALSAIAENMLIEPSAGEMTYTVDGDLYRTRVPLTVALGPALSLVHPAAGAFVQPTAGAKTDK